MGDIPVCGECRHLGKFLECKHPKLTDWSTKYTWYKKIKGPHYPKSYQINKTNNCIYFEKRSGIFSKLISIALAPDIQPIRKKEI